MSSHSRLQRIRAFGNEIPRCRCRVVTLGKLDIMKLISRTMLTSAISFAWKLIRTGERVVEAAESWGINDPHAGFAELSVRKVGTAITSGARGLSWQLTGSRFGGVITTAKCRVWLLGPPNSLTASYRWQARRRSHARGATLDLRNARAPQLPKQPDLLSRTI